MRLSEVGDDELLREAYGNARLTSTQARAATLAGRGASYRELAAILAIPYPAARRAAMAASRKLRRAHPHLVSLDRAWLKDMFHCLRNVRPRAPATPPIYAPLRGGGFEKRPVSLRPRPEGEVPEDLQLCPLRFLRELPRLLAQCAVSP